MTPRPASPSRQARERAGLAPAEAAALLGISVSTLRRLERRGGWRYYRAEQAARRYQREMERAGRAGTARLEEFLHGTGWRTKAETAETAETKQAGNR